MVVWVYFSYLETFKSLWTVRRLRKEGSSTERDRHRQRGRGEGRSSGSQGVSKERKGVR